MIWRMFWLMILNLPVICILSCIAIADDFICDFEYPWETWRVTSYPYEDQDPSQWEFNNTHGVSGTSSSFHLIGNTWKFYDISDLNIQINDNSIWEIFIYAPTHGSLQGFGITDGTKELIYIFEATESPILNEALTCYAGWKTTSNSFQKFKLSVGEDWKVKFGPFDSNIQVHISKLIFINDGDITQGNVYFDQIKNISESEPMAPSIDIGPDQSAVPYEAIQFYCNIFDPDSTDFEYNWDFSDGAISHEPYPNHAFERPGIYNVLCKVTDETGLTAIDTKHIWIESSTPIISMAMGGDCMFARRYEDADENGIPGDNDGSLILPNDNGEGAWNIGYHINRLFADFKISNLETPLTNQGYRHPTKSIAFRSRPDSVSGLKSANISVVSLSNNHLIDYMDAGIAQTIDVLNHPSEYSPFATMPPILHFGGGETWHNASQFTSVSYHGTRVGFVGLCSIVGESNNEQPFFHAGYQKPGVLKLTTGNLNYAVSKCKQNCDITVVVIHGGIEYSDMPSDNMVNFAYQAIDNGADMVVCHHPHVCQGIEIYENKPILYSLGNLIFEQKYQKTMISYMANVSLDRNRIHQISLVPIYIENWIPKFIKGESAERICFSIGGLSDLLGTTLIPQPVLGQIFLNLSSANYRTYYTNLSLNVPTTYVPNLQSYFSDIHQIQANEILSSIESINNVNSSFSVLLGKEKLMFGNFEDDDIDSDINEGIGWDIPGTTSASISDYNPHCGNYCLRLRRHSNNYTSVEVNSKWRIPVSQNHVYCLSGWVRYVNATNLQASVRCYFYPYTWTSYWDEEIPLLGPLSGSQEWTHFQKYFSVPENLDYIDIHLSMDPPVSSGYGYGYFDDIHLIEFNIIDSPDLPYDFSNPLSTRFLALKSESAENEATMEILFKNYDAPDQDNDGLFDFLEDVNGNNIVDEGETNPNLQDTDQDGLNDAEEFSFGLDLNITNATSQDTDGDGYDDYSEFLGGTCPNDPDSHPSGPTITPSPTPTFILNTPTPSPPPPTSTQTITPTMSPTFSPTPHPFYTKTPTASPNTQTPTPTPTVFLNILLSSTHFMPEEICWVKLESSYEGQSFSGDIYFLLECYDLFWCWPSWTSTSGGLDKKTIYFAPRHHELIDIIDPFQMPKDIAPDGPFRFYSAVFLQDSLSLEDLKSNLCSAEFFIGR